VPSIAHFRLRDYVLVVRAAVLTIAVRVALSTLPFRFVRRLLMNRATPVRGTYTVDEIVWAVRGISKYVPGATCLTQAFVSQRLLAKSGFPCQIRIGVAKDPDRGFESHAWVECDGRVVIGESDGATVTNLFTSIAAWEG
jgi:hypothetical protein